jgi:hypothetical protein
MGLKMKKIVCGILVLLLCIIGAAMPAYAEEDGKIKLDVVESGLYAYAVLPDGTAAIVGTTEELTGDITLPTAIDGYTVTSLGVDSDVYSEDAFINADVTYSLKLTLPEGYTSLYGDFIFSGSLFLPSTLEIYEVGICGPYNINVSPDNKYFASVDGVLFSKDLTKLIKVGTDKALFYRIPDGTVSIGESAFFNIFTDPIVYIPESVTDIDPHTGTVFQIIITPDGSYTSENYISLTMFSPVEFTLICIGIVIVLAGVVVLIVVLIKQAKKKKKAAKE